CGPRGTLQPNKSWSTAPQSTGAQGRTRTGTALRPGDFKSPAATNYATRAVGAGTSPSGGGGRNRTGVHGFAGRCMTTLPPRPRNNKGKRLIAGLPGRKSAVQVGA